MKLLRDLLFCLLALGAGLAPVAATAAGSASEITIRNSAIEKMLLAELFIDRGRYYLLPETACQYAYADSPRVTIAKGRVRIDVRLSGRFSAVVDEQCAGGTSDVVQVALSARPTFAGEKIVLTDIRVDEISNEAYRMLLQQFLASAIPRAISIDVRQGLQRLLADRQSTYDVVVDRFSTSEIVAENNQLRVALTFAMTAR